MQVLTYLVSSREGVIHRITPRRNDSVNDSWMADSGRELYKSVTDEKRLLSPCVEDEKSDLSSAINSATYLFTGQKTWNCRFMSSLFGRTVPPNQTCQNNKAKKFLRGHFGDDDGILVSADRTPNLRGTLVTGFSSKYPTDDLSEIQRQSIRKSINLY